ncbi:MAG: alpha-amylase family glycosyl hydrolase, partial [Thermoanaerobaculia bacterium]
MFRSALAAALLLTLSCTSTDAFASRRRAVPPAVAAPQWNHEWSRGAVFYEVFVRSFYDSNGDGIGDFDGLIAKLDYLNDGNPATTTDLGVDALWLMP